MLGSPLVDRNNCTKESTTTRSGGEHTDLLLQLSISDGSLSGRDWTVVDDGSPLAVSIDDMAIDRVVTGVGLASDEPTISTWEKKKESKLGPPHHGLLAISLEIKLIPFGEGRIAVIHGTRPRFHPTDSFSFFGPKLFRITDRSLVHTRISWRCLRV